MRVPSFSGLFMVGPLVLASVCYGVSVGPETALTFESGKAQLTHQAKEELHQVVKDARNKGKLDGVKIAVWSDNPAPRDGEQLSTKDKNLAAKRIDSIEHYLKELKVSGVDTFNMAERASWLARAFNTENAELKSEIGRGGDSPMSKQEFQIFKDKGAASKAVVLVILKK